VGAPARREGFGSVHSASRPGGRSHRDNAPLFGFGGTGGPAGKGSALCILLRGQAAAPTRMVRALV